MARPGRAFESRIRVKEDGRAAFSERQNARLSWPRFDSIDEPKSPCRPSSNRRSPCHLHRSTVKKNIYIYTHSYSSISRLKKKKNFDRWNDRKVESFSLFDLEILLVPEQEGNPRNWIKQRTSHTGEGFPRVRGKDNRRNTRHILCPCAHLNPRRSEFSTMPLVNRA